MTEDRLERRLPEVLVQLALPAVPDYTDDILRQTARTRQRPGWTLLERWLPMDFAVHAPVGARQLPWRTLGAVALLALLAALAVSIMGSQSRRLPPPYGPAANGSVLFERNGDIYVLDPATHEPRVLVAGSGREFAPTWSLDGSRFFFGRDVSGGVAAMVANADGANVRMIKNGYLEDPESADWSASGSEIAVIHSTPGQPTLSILTVDGSQAPRDLALAELQPTKFVTWRPGTQELLFLAHPNGVASDLGLYAIGSNGSGLRELIVRHGETNDVPNTTQISLQNINLAAGGGIAAYWNWETTVQPGRNCFVHLLDLKTGADRRMTYDNTADCELFPQLSPDGKTIVLERGGPPGANSQALVAQIDGGGSRLVGPTYYYTEREGLRLSPDGTKLLIAGSLSKSHLVTLATGASVEIDSVLIGASWQRLAP
jgi:Tol biopolymer transport system component